MCSREKVCCGTLQEVYSANGKKQLHPKGGEGTQHHAEGEHHAKGEEERNTTKRRKPSSTTQQRRGKVEKRNWKKSKTRKREKTQREGKKKRENSEDEARTTRECLEPLKNNKKTTKPADKPKKGSVPKTDFNHPESFDLGAFSPHFFFLTNFDPNERRKKEKEKKRRTKKERREKKNR